jgi:hypothetical protein
MISYKDTTFTNENCSKLIGTRIPLISRNVRINDFLFERCTFEGNGITSFGDPINRPIISNIQLNKCSVYSWFTGVQFEDIQINDMATGKNHLFLFACVYKHVKLSGNIGTLIISSDWGMDTVKHKKRNLIYAKANIEYYRDIDWSIDISEVNASGIEIRGGIPTNQIIRNKENQMIITRKEAELGRWKNNREIDTSAIKNAIEDIIHSGEEEGIIILGSRSKNYQKNLSILQEMKRSGIVF